MPSRRAHRKLTSRAHAAANLSLVLDLCETMEFGSLCAMGGFTPYPARSAIRHWPEDFTTSKVKEAAE